MKTRFGWKLPSLSGMAMLLAYGGTAISTGCAAPPWDRTMPSGQPSAAVQRYPDSHVARSRGARSTKPGHPANFGANAVANASRPVGLATGSSRRHIASEAPVRTVAARMPAGSTADSKAPSVALPASTVRDHGRAEKSYQAALKCWKSGDSDGAKRHLDEALAAHPRHRDANLLLAEWCLLSGRPEDATSRIAQLCRDHPHDAKAFHTLGTLLAATGRDRDALALFERAASLAPDDKMYQYAVKAASGRDPGAGTRDLLAGSDTRASDERESTTLAAKTDSVLPVRLDGKASASVKLDGKDAHRANDADLANSTPGDTSNEMIEHTEIFRVVTSPTARAAMVAEGTRSVRSRSEDRACSVCASEPQHVVADTSMPAQAIRETQPDRFEPEDALPLDAEHAADALEPETNRIRLRIAARDNAPVSEERSVQGATGCDDLGVRKASASVETQEPLHSTLRLKTTADSQDDGATSPEPRPIEHFDPSARPVDVAVSGQQHGSERLVEEQPGQDVAGSVDYRALLAEAVQAYEANQPSKGRQLLEQSAQATAASDQEELAVVEVAVEAMRHAEDSLAIELLEPAAARSDATARIFRTLGTAYYRTGDFPLAMQALERAVSLDSTSALSYFLLGSTLNKLGKQREAAAYWQRAALLDPRYSDHP